MTHRTDDPAATIERFAECMNAGDVDAALRLYAPDACGARKTAPGASPSTIRGAAGHDRADLIAAARG